MDKKVKRFEKRHPDLHKQDRHLDNKGRTVLPFYPPGPKNATVIKPEPNTPEQRRISVYVERVMDKMQPEHAELLRMIYWEGMTQEEVAKERGITQQAVSYQLTVAKKMFAIQMILYGEEVTDDVERLIGLN
jgi:RNA polymerase sigma factor (sigma-70 family)